LLTSSATSTLHVAHRDDCGGCSVKPVFAGSEERTIHKIWDTTLIEIYEETYEGSDSDLWEELAYDLRSTITAEERARWSASLSPVAWAQESLEIAQQDVFRYVTGDTLPPAYSALVYDRVALRLKQAGIRLAALLNRVFSSQNLPF
jgi:hypothetical protein